MSGGRGARVFTEMLREEWRLHSRLFGGGRFGSFPVVVGLLATGAGSLLLVTGTGPETVVAGLHALVFVFGLNTGSIGFVGQDRLRDLLGDVTLLVFAARTLPLARGRLLGIFVLKDVVYYAVLFLLPLAVGWLLALSGFGPAAGLVTRLGTGSLLWSTLILTFCLGLGTTIAILGLLGRGIPGVALAGLVAVAIGLAFGSGGAVLSLSPYGLFAEFSPVGLAASTATVLAVFLLAGLSYDPGSRRPARTVGPPFRRWLESVGDPLATRTLLDVHRSAGGFGKVLFSAAVLLGVTASLVELATRITGLAPSVGISYGAILGLSGFTTYNWLTQSDDVGSYLVHPVGVPAIIAAKFRAFLLLGPVVGLGFYAIPVLWLGTPILEAGVGALLLVGVACYIFGTTVSLAGLSPTEFLFDSLLFGVFSLAMIVPLVPILVVGFALAPVSGGLLAALTAVAISLAGVGVGLYRRWRPKWARRYRA
jgi:uncharacterized membrane protein YuzA (DUF378 family)